MPAAGGARVRGPVLAAGVAGPTWCPGAGAGGQGPSGVGGPVLAAGGRAVPTAFLNLDDSSQISALPSP